MSEGPEIEVLLATFNGERFLQEQIDSILAQTLLHVRILARDDGSVDATLDILKSYAERLPHRFQLVSKGDASGSAKNNFLQLMRSSTAKYICFADQDDVWLPDKITKTKLAMDQLELQWGVDTPLLVFTDLRVVDGELATIHESFWNYTGIDPQGIHDQPQLMVRSVVTGCTCMINRALLKLALRMPESAFMHDRWIGLLASFLGKSDFLKEPTVLYRQHGRNVVGAGRGLDSGKPPSRSFLKKILMYRCDAGWVSLWNISQRDARSFLGEYGAELSAEKRALLRTFLRCQSSRSRLVRVATYLSNRFSFRGIKEKVSFAMYLWSMKPDPSS